MPAYVIYILGWPGVGKLTIARALQKLISGSEVLHNHEVIDPVEKLYSRKHPLYRRKRSECRQARLEPIKHDPKFRDTVFIFTDAQTQYNDSVSDYTDLAHGEHARRFYSVILYCELEENERRLVSADRGGGNGKLTDVAILREYRAPWKDGIFKFGDDEEIEIDVIDLAPEDAAARIRDFVERRETEGRSWDDVDDGLP